MYPAPALRLPSLSAALAASVRCNFCTEDQDFQIGRNTLKDTKYELLIVIANQGYSGLIMDAARSENAGGGTVIHAKGTGMERAEQFLGVSLAAEKELVQIVIKREDKTASCAPSWIRRAPPARHGRSSFPCPSPPPPACACWKTKSRKRGLRNKQSLL